MSGGPTPLIEPWASLVKSAGAARARFSGNIALGEPGPLRERLDDLERKVAECEAECFRIASRGQHLAVTAAGLGLEALRATAEAARVAADADPSDVDRRNLADAYAEELESAERLDRLAAQTEVKLRQLVAELNSVANQALEVTMTPTSGIEVSALVDQLDALRAALTEVDHEVGG